MIQMYRNLLYKSLAFNDVNMEISHSYSLKDILSSLFRVMGRNVKYNLSVGDIDIVTFSNIGLNIRNLEGDIIVKECHEGYNFYDSNNDKEELTSYLNEKLHIQRDSVIYNEIIITEIINSRVIEINNNPLFDDIEVLVNSFISIAQNGNLIIHDTVTRNALDEDMINNLEKREYDGSGETPFCAICQEDEYEVGSKIVKLDCSHEYHFECISNWLVRSNLCPVCKTSIDSNVEVDVDVENPPINVV